MRRFAIIGSGLAGLLTAHGLRRAGHEVTLFSDRSPKDWLERSRPTGTAARFDLSLSYDRELGLAHWDGVAAGGEGISLAFGLRPRNRLVSLTGRLARPFLALDVRLTSARWMGDLEERGGRVVIESVSVARLDEIAAAHDLTIVASGRAELWQLFPRHAARSVYEQPQRQLCMIITRGGRMGFDGVPFLPVRFNLNLVAGEAFWIPFHHKDHGPTWNLVFEAKAGGPMDRFQGARSGEEALAIAKEVIRDLAPWDAKWAAPMTLADPNGWLVGAVPPTVRDPVGRLPSGRVVTGVGDALISLDPIGGQGANNVTRMARHLVAAIVARGDAPFDEPWITDTFERYWSEHGRHIVQFNNLLLEPLTAAGRTLLISQYGSDGVGDGVAQRLADAFAANFNDPRLHTAAFVDPARARALVGDCGGSHPLPFLRGALGVARGQLRQALGLGPAHPGGHV